MSSLLGLDPFTLFLGFVVFFFFSKVLSSSRNAKLINKLPGPRAYPIVGNIVEMLEPKDRMTENIMKRRKKFGSIFRLWFGLTPTVVFSKPEYVEIILRSSKHSEKSSTYRFLHSWLGRGLLTSYGKKWLSHRKLITPTFHFKVLQGFVNVFHENSKILVQKLEEKAKTGEGFNIFPLVTNCALDIICETAMGTKVNAQSEDKNEYVTSVYSLSHLIVYRMSRMWLHFDFLFKRSGTYKEMEKHLGIVKGFTEKVIKSRKEALEKKNSFQDSSAKSDTKLSFLDCLLESSMENGVTQLTVEELREEVDTFMFEGHDTTAAAINWVLFLLGHHPQIQEEVYQEVKAIFQDDPDRPVTIADVAEMKLLERVLKESLRLYPSVPSFGRVIEEDVQFGDYMVPKGTDAFISVYAIHRDPAHYPNPEVFDPDRFLPENIQNRHPYSYIPFSAGPRNCIGQKFALYEEKVVLSALIRNFKFESLEMPEDKKKIPELILRPVSGIRVKISKR